MESGNHPASGNHFQFFYQKKQFFRIAETDFQPSTNRSFFSVQWKCTFLTNRSFQLLEKDFLFIGNCLLYLRVLSYQFKTVTHMRGKHFLKKDLNSCQWKNHFLASGNHFFYYLRYLQEVFYPGQWKHIFQSRRNSIDFFLLVETII